MPRQFGPFLEITEDISVEAGATDKVVAYTALDTVIDGPVMIVGMATQQSGGTGEVFVDMELPGGGERPRMCFPILTPASDVVPRFLPTEWTNDISEMGAWRFPVPIGWKFREELRFHFANTDGDAHTVTLYLYVVPCTDADIDAVRRMGLHPAVAVARYELAANGSISDDGNGAIEMSRDRGFLPLHQYIVGTSASATSRWRLESIEKQQAALAQAKQDGGYKRTAWWSRRPIKHAYWGNTGIDRARTPRQWAPRGSKLYLEAYDQSGNTNTITHYLIGMASEDPRETPATITQKLEAARKLVGAHELARV